MFWGVTIDGGKRYSQMVERSFHISMAALEPGSAKEAISVMIRHENSEFLLCSLNCKTVLQQYLDLNFTEGEEVSFFLSGSGIVHLTGFLLEEEEEEDDADYIPMEDSDVDTESSDEDAPELIPAGQSQFKDIKRKLEGNFNSKTKNKKAKLFNDEEDDDDDDEEEEDDGNFIEDEALEDLDDEESEEDSEDNFIKEEAQPVLAKKKKGNDQNKTPKEHKKKIKEDKQTPKNSPKTPKDEKKTPKHGSGDNQAAAETPGELTESKKKKRKKNKKNKEARTPENGEGDSTPGGGKSPVVKRVVAGGTIIQERKVGHGPEAKPGKMVHVYYSGKLTSGKPFDSCMSGKPFGFKLGRNEVIKGWDNGVAGMKVGGKRLITVPPQQGYGSQRQGPIPANSTLVFEVELKAVS